MEEETPPEITPLQFSKDTKVLAYRWFDPTGLAFAKPVIEVRVHYDPHSNLTPRRLHWQLTVAFQAMLAALQEEENNDR